MDEVSSEEVDLPFLLVRQSRVPINPADGHLTTFDNPCCSADCFIKCEPFATTSVGIFTHFLASHHTAFLLEALWQGLYGKDCFNKSFGKSCLAIAAGRTCLLDLVGRS